jgi:hypothetical protein
MARRQRNQALSLIEEKWIGADEPLPRRRAV